MPKEGEEEVAPVTNVYSPPRYPVTLSDLAIIQLILKLSLGYLITGGATSTLPVPAMSLTVPLQVCPQVRDTVPHVYGAGYQAVQSRKSSGIREDRYAGHAVVPR